MCAYKVIIAEFKYVSQQYCSVLCCTVQYPYTLEAQAQCNLPVGLKTTVSPRAPVGTPEFLQY